MQGEAAHLNDLFIRHTREEDVLFILIRIEPNHVGDFSITKPLDTLPCLSIPQFYLAIVGTRQESTTIV